MTPLPISGRISCNNCYECNHIEFDRTRREEEGWRITANPLAWGNPKPEIVVLGFSKGPTQQGALATAKHDEIAYKGSRQNIGKIFRYLGLITGHAGSNFNTEIDSLIADEMSRFHFGSLIRCTVERWDDKAAKWKGSGGGMLDKFIATEFGREVTKNCVSQYLAELPSKTKLVLMFGLGTKLGYVHQARKLFESARPGNWKTINDVSYSDGDITVVHVEHFASQGALLPNWLGANDHPRKDLGQQARFAVNRALSVR